MSQPSLTTLTAEQVKPNRLDVLEHQGFPPQAPVNDRTEAMLNQAYETFARLAAVTAITLEVGRDEYAYVYAGEGDNLADDPLAQIYQSAYHLRLFAATVGSEVSDEIARLLAAGDLAEGSLLDSVASTAADQAAEKVEQQCGEQELRGKGQPELGIMRFSPGYCGWHISGQKRLFERLAPEAIGISINERYLMTPLKSVSGVVVIARKHEFQFDSDFIFCGHCRNRSCQQRYETMLAQFYQ